MTIRKAEEKDIPRMIELLGQVLQIHADIRPDIFIPGTTKYTVSELSCLVSNISDGFSHCIANPALYRAAHFRA